MNRLLLLLALTVFSSGVCAQNLFDYSHSLRYANYLFDTEEYETAAKEYERVLFMSDSIFLKQRLIASYRKLGRYDKALKRFSTLYPTLSSAPAPLILEYSKLMLVTKEFDKADSLFQFSDNLSKEEKQIGLVHTNLLRQDWAKARISLNQLYSDTLDVYKNYNILIERALNQPRKSAFKGTMLSIVVPGLGKVYTKDWKDGIVSFLFFGTMAWQSYKGFSRKGIESIPGWAFGAIGSGFYIGNIFGTVKAVRRFNKVTNEAIYNEVKRLCYRDF